MNRQGLLAFACLATAWLALAVCLGKPGLPVELRAAEPNHLLLASSLGIDGDTAYEDRDADRLFGEFPFDGRVRLDLRPSAEGRAPELTGSWLYGLLGAPFVALLGARGLVLLNALLLLAAVLLGARHFRSSGGEDNDPAQRRGPLFASLFFLLGASGAYVFRLHPAVLWMTLMATAFAVPSLGGRGDRRRWRFVAGGGALGLAIVELPWLALFAPLLVPGLWKKEVEDLRPDSPGRPVGRWNGTLPWLGGAVAGLALATAMAGLLRTAAGPDVSTYEIASPYERPWVDDGSAGVPATPDPAFPTGAADAARGLGQGFLGRRTGLLPYFPFAALVLISAAAGWRSGRIRWSWLGVALAYAGIQPFLGHPGFGGEWVANPWLVPAYPAFLFALRRPLGPRAILAGATAAGILVGPLLFTTLGPPVPGSGVHAHTRAFPYPHLPFDPAQAPLDGYSYMDLTGPDGTAPRLWYPRDHATPIGEELWLQGGERVELWLESPEPVPASIFLVRNYVDDNVVRLDVGGDRERLHFGVDLPPNGATSRIEAEPSASRTADLGRGPQRIYRLRVDTESGAWPIWGGKVQERWYVGAGLAFLGTTEALGADVFAARWLGCGAPPTVAPGEEFLVLVRIENASTHPWPAAGPARVRLSHRWRTEGAEGPGVGGQARTDLPATVAPGGEAQLWQTVRAPDVSGRYVLEIDPIYEYVGWFSERGVEPCRVEITVSEDAALRSVADAGP
ncbi:MAG: hypothetical protein AAGN66_06325 [Acidobacteriota bacterium]